MAKTNKKGFCKDTIEKLTKNWPGVSYLVLSSKPMVPRDRLLIAIGWKYNAQKVLSFFVIDNAGSTQTGINYLSKYPDQYTNVSICPVDCPLVMYFFILLISLNPTTNQGSLIWHWRSSGLLIVVGCGYIQQLLWKQLLLIVGNCFVMGSKETTMKNWLVSESSRNDLLYIASTMIFHLMVGPQHRTYPPLMRLIMEIQFLPAVQFIFTVIFLPPQWPALFSIWLSTVPHQYLLDLSIFPKKKKPNREGYITGLLEVNFQGILLMEIYASREDFGFARDVIGSTRRCNIVYKFAVIVLKRIMNPSFVSLDMFHVWLVHNNDDCLG